MKWEFDPSSQVARREAVGLTERLRTEARWPVPRQRVVESDACLFVIQELLPGRPAPSSRTNWSTSSSSCTAGDSGWPARTTRPVAGPSIETLTTGGNGYCLHEPLRRYDRRTAQLVGRIEQLGRSLRPDDLSAPTSCTGICTPATCWSPATTSPRWSTPTSSPSATRRSTWSPSPFQPPVPCEAGVGDRLLAMALDGLTEPKRQAYLGHLFLRVIDWPIRGGRPDEVEFPGWPEPTVCSTCDGRRSTNSGDGCRIVVAHEQCPTPSDPSIPPGGATYPPPGPPHRRPATPRPARHPGRRVPDGRPIRGRNGAHGGGARPSAARLPRRTRC